MMLSNRLLALASFVEKGDRPADIGTDHAYIPVFLIQSGLCETVIAADILKGPLDSARKTAEIWSVSDKITFYLTDGLSGISTKEYDAVIIAGMGGETIIKILSAHISKELPGECAVKYILQPMTKKAELCGWLYDNGYYVEDEKLAEDAGVIYRIMLIKRGLRKKPGNTYLHIGKKLIENRDPLLEEYLKLHIEKTEKAISGIKSGKKEALERLGALEELLDGFSGLYDLLKGS